MLVDGRSVPADSSFTTDLCIIGAGAAGITLARELANAPFEVTLVESGGFELDPETQVLTDGKIVGMPYRALPTTRLRCFGGTTQHWGGWCRAFDDIDFSERDWVPHSGWPIKRADLADYYVRAHEICQLGPFVYDTKDWDLGAAQPFQFTSTDVKSKVIQFSPPTRFGLRYRDAILHAPNTKLYLYSNVVMIEPSENGRQIARLELKTLSGTRFSIRAKQYVLATGGIENARLLLASNQKIAAGIGNENDLVGRYFSDHMQLDTGGIFPLRTDASFDLYQLEARDKIHKPASFAGRPTPLMGYLTLTDAAQKSARTLNYSGNIQRSYWSDYFMHTAKLHKNNESGFQEFTDGLTTIWNNMKEATDVAFTDRSLSITRTFYKITTTQEQAPNANSRVTLSTEKDKLGLPIVELDWQLTDLDKHTIRTAMKMIASALSAPGIARLHVPVRLEVDEWPAYMGISAHHSGTTRMHSNPKFGVVDANCQVHGISNLFVIGSSVFPTNSHGNPTLTIVAMSLRLADLLRTRLR
jgi:choline dehydrogenase-like flavoprotein